MIPQEPNPRLDRVNFELRSTGVKPAQMTPLRTGTHTRGYLPHVKREGASYFVTTRLADSLPKEVFLKLQSEKAERLARFYSQKEAAESLGTSPPEPQTLEAIERDFFRKLEAYLDQGHGECWLRRPQVAELVVGALQFFKDQRYRLDAWVIMANHVHAVLWPMPNHTLSEINQSWKRYTAREANKLLQRTGQPFWEPESYDHWIRGDAEHARCCGYVIRNPVKARLCESPGLWKWGSAWRQTQSK